MRGRLGTKDDWMYFFFFAICALGLMPIVVVDEQHLLPPLPFVPNTASSLTASTAVAVPSISLLMRLFPPYHVACVKLSWSTAPPPCGTSSPAPETVMVQVWANDAA